ncbi:SLC38A9 [Lepeophtheirus salmonis]|uniref:SLC38A9 n=1 Tax=Lepeophtheirus salmonis TaxID=72036 RepID=A0A7R8H797_LEPSM|nr:SLC38A9 [Lepeophtheirus salmonis]CAF2897935.1 SLC38A9 [Lepeophtheirus salmonis]
MDFSLLNWYTILGIFIHNCVITITDNNKNQENNARDVRIAFSLVTFTYLMIGTLFYITFPMRRIVSKIISSITFIPMMDLPSLRDGFYSFNLRQSSHSLCTL